jgi:membrane fusion protein, multidrug efflux system
MIFLRCENVGPTGWHRVLRAFCVLGFVLSLCLPAACSMDANGSAKANDRGKKPVVSVTAALVAEKDVPVQVQAIGNVQAYTTVTIKAQIDGAITAVHFEEGQKVKKGDLIFSIDSRPFEAKLKQAEAILAKEKAQLQTAKKQVERYAAVVSKGFVSQEKFDQIIADSAALEAGVRADEAAVESARLELRYCSITSPIDGYVGEIKVNHGNVVKANDNEKPLVIINQTSPIYVSFAVPEQNLPAIKKYMAKGKLKTQVVVPGEEDQLARGELTFLDNTVDTATGTILLKATFSNEDRQLWPGQFVNVMLTLTTEKGAVVIPSRAVQTGQQGPFVFVVKPDSTVEYRQVTAGRMFGNDIVITKGVATGEKVVTDGHLRLAQGSPVKVVDDGENSGGGPRQ